MVKNDYDQNIELRVKEFFKTIGQSDQVQSVTKKRIALGTEKSGNFELHEIAGDWEITLRDGTTYPLTLTFEEMYEASNEHSEKIKAAIFSCVTKTNPPKYHSLKERR